MADEVEIRLVDAFDATASPGEAALVGANEVPEWIQRGSISCREDDAIERRFCAVDEPRPASGELGDPGFDADRAGPNGVDEVKPNQRYIGQFVSTGRGNTAGPRSSSMNLAIVSVMRRCTVSGSLLIGAATY